MGQIGLSKQELVNILNKNSQQIQKTISGEIIGIYRSRQGKDLEDYDIFTTASGVTNGVLINFILEVIAMNNQRLYQDLIKRGVIKD